MPVSSKGARHGDPVVGAAARTVASGSSRLFSAWSQGSPVPDVMDRRCEGVADFSTRRARVSQVPLGTALLASEFAGEHQGDDEDSVLQMLSEPREVIYDGANAYLRVGANWTGFFLGDPAGPRVVNDPLWPLDALFGARPGVEIGGEAVRGVAATRYRLTLDLAAADAALSAGVTVPALPYRVLTHMPAEVWLDAAGLARRIAVVTEPTARDDQSLVWSIVELWDFGVAADIQPPSPDAVLRPRDAFRLGPAGPAA